MTRAGVSNEREFHQFYFVDRDFFESGFAAEVGLRATVVYHFVCYYRQRFGGNMPTPEDIAKGTGIPIARVLTALALLVKREAITL